MSMPVIDDAEVAGLMEAFVHAALGCDRASLSVAGNAIAAGAWGSKRPPLLLQMHAMGLAIDDVHKPALAQVLERGRKEEERQRQIEEKKERRSQNQKIGIQKSQEARRAAAEAEPKAATEQSSSSTAHPDLSGVNAEMTRPAPKPGDTPSVRLPFNNTNRPRGEEGPGF